MEYFPFAKYVKLAFERTGLKQGIENDFHGGIQVKDVESVVRKFMGDWTEWQGGEGEPERFITPTEYTALFNENVGLQLEREIERAVQKADNDKEKAKRKKEQNLDKWFGASSNKLDDKLDSYLEKKLFGGFVSGEESVSTKKYIKKAIKKFYTLYPAYDLFGIRTEGERRAIADHLEQDEDNYFWAMRASNPQLSDFFLKWRHFRIPEKARQKHTYIVAGTGAGKSELLKSLVWQHIVKRNTGVVVIDPNGDFAEQIAKFKENGKSKFKDRLVYIDPFFSPEFIPIINPFELPEASEQVLGKATQQLFKTFVAAFTDLDSPPTAAMQTILLNMIPVILRKPDGSLRDIFRFLDFEANDDLIELGRSIPNVDIRRYFQNSFTKRNLAASIPGMESRFYRMATSGIFMNLVCGKSTINLKKALNEKKIIVFNLSKGKLGDDLSRIYGRFILTSTLNTIFARADINENDRVPCHIYIDEFHNYITSTIKEAFVEGRKYKGFLTVATQTIGQDMTTSFKDLILGNANVKIIGGAGYKSRREMMQEMDIDEETERMTGINKKTFKKLKIGKFIVQIGNNEPMKITNGTRLLGNKHSMKSDKWEAIKQEQLSRYYVRRKEFPNIENPIEDNKSSSIPPRTKSSDEFLKEPKNDESGTNKKRPFNPKFDL